jgi:GNAT superfamily N-acetyltransferase
MNSMAYRELSASPEDRALLRRFYELYVAEFPHPDERESLENMTRYLELKDHGWYGANNYHVVLLLLDDEVIGGSVSDYLADPNTGVIEFLVVAPGSRRRGAGGRLLRWTEEAVAADARTRAGRALDYVVAEMEDPFKVRPSDASLDAFLRTEIWDRWGYRRLDFPYVQPALSAGQHAATHLMLVLKATTPDPPARDRDAVPALVVKRIVHEYLRWAMRIPHPGTSTQYAGMARYLDARENIHAESLLAYIGRDTRRPLSIREVSDASDPDVEDLLRIYETAFPPGPTTVQPERFRTVLDAGAGRDRGYRRHLWAVRPAPGEPVEGMV